MSNQIFTLPFSSTGRIKVSPENLSISLPTGLTVTQRAQMLHVEVSHLSKIITMTPNCARSGNNYLTFSQPVLISSSPEMFSPETGCAIFNTNSPQSFVEIGFVPVSGNKPHLVEIFVDILSVSKVTPGYEFQVKMFTGLDPAPVQKFSFGAAQLGKPIVFTFPPVEKNFSDKFLVIQLSQMANNGADMGWGFYCVKIVASL